jgi:hypothetical protein
MQAAVIDDLHALFYSYACSRSLRRYVGCIQAIAIEDHDPGSCASKMHAAAIENINPESHVSKCIPLERLR